MCIRDRPYEEHSGLVGGDREPGPGDRTLLLGRWTEPVGVDAVADDDAAGPHPSIGVLERGCVGRGEVDNDLMDTPRSIPHQVTRDGEGMKGVAQDPSERATAVAHRLQHDAMVDIDIPSESVVVADDHRPWRLPLRSPPRQHCAHSRKPHHTSGDDQSAAQTRRASRG